MTKDPIVAAVRRRREALLRRCGYDLKKLAQYLRQQRHKTGLTIVHKKVKRTRPA